MTATEGRRRGGEGRRWAGAGRGGDRHAIYQTVSDPEPVLYLGVGSLEASLLASFGLTLPHMSAAQQSSRGLMEWQKSATESGDTAAAEDAIRLTYDLGRMFATPEASRLLIGQLVGISMEKRALEALPADAQRDYIPVTPAQRLAELDKQKQAVKEVVATSEWLMQTRDEQLLAEYLRRLRNEGELPASNWLKTQKK